jgi:hypothetical protein
MMYFSGGDMMDEFPIIDEIQLWLMDSPQWNYVMLTENVYYMIKDLQTMDPNSPDFE